MTYHKRRYRTEPEFAAREKERSKAYYSRADELRKRRMYLASTYYRLREAKARKLLQAQKLENAAALVKVELESVKWQIYAQRKR